MKDRCICRLICRKVDTGVEDWRPLWELELWKARTAEKVKEKLVKQKEIISHIRLIKIEDMYFTKAKDNKHDKNTIEWFIWNKSYQNKVTYKKISKN